MGDIKADNRRSEFVPALASRGKHRLTIKNPLTIAYDLLFGCTGWLQGLIQADTYIRNGSAKRVLVVGTETLSRICDPHDRRTVGAVTKFNEQLGLIDQWGNGLKLIADELKGYPEIEFRWYERGGLQFQVQFLNKKFVAQQELQDIDGTTRSLRKKLSVLLKAIRNNEGRRLPEYIEATNLGSQTRIIALKPCWSR